MKKKQLSKKDIKDINADLNDKYGLEEFIGKKANVELLDDTFLRVNGKILFFFIEDELIPTLKLISNENFLKKITVDMGAVKFVVNGADVMRPGIVDVDSDISKNDIICVVDVNNKKPLAIGKALLGSEEMKSSEGGKVIANLHYVGDEVWNFD